MDDTEKDTETKLKADLDKFLKRLTALQEQRATQESVVKALTREIYGCEAVVQYIKQVLSKKE